MPRRTTLLITASLVLTLAAFLHFVESQAAEPFFGPPNLGDMIFYIGGGSLLILASGITAAWVITSTARRTSKPTTLLVVLPLMLGITFSISAILEYSGDVRARHQSLLELERTTPQE